MPNHCHLVLRPLVDGEMSRFMGWVGGTHTMRYHAHYHTSGLGHVYQQRYKSFPIQDDEHFFVVCRYVERNALRAGLVSRAEDWRWGSLWRLASIARTRTEAACTMANTAIAELGGSGQRTAHRRCVGRCPAMCSAWPTIRRRRMGGIDRAQTRFGIHHASPWPSESPTCARRTNQRGLTPLISCAGDRSMGGHPISS